MHGPEKIFVVKMKPGVVGQGKCDSVTVVGSYARDSFCGLFTNRVQRYLNSLEVMCTGVKYLNTKCG